MAKHDKHKPKPVEDDKELHKDVHEDAHVDSEVTESKIETDTEEQKPEEESSHENVEKQETESSEQKQRRSIFKKWWNWAIAHKKVSIPVAVVLLLAIIAAAPFTRYLVAGMFLRQTFPVIVVDAETGKPVSSANVKLGGNIVETDAEGRAEFKPKVGRSDLEVTKNYYEGITQNVLVSIKKPGSAYEVKIKAIGRAVPVTVTNKISKKPAANVTISAEGSEAKTTAEGKAVLVVPAEAKEVKVTLTGDGFNTSEVTVTVTADEIPANIFEVTPTGKMYFLSNASGKIDLVKSNLDGSDRQTVLAGTGKEDRYNTVLLASSDWKYIALLSKRDGGEYAKLFLIETGTDKVTTMDEGEAGFDVYGWSGDRFIYTVSRAKKQVWEPERGVLKSYSVPDKKITALEKTEATGDSQSYAYENFGNVYILGEQIAFTKNWQTGCSYSIYCTSKPVWNGKQSRFYTVKVDGTQLKVIKGYDELYIDSRTADFGEIYVLYGDKVDEYHNGKIEPIDQDEDNFYNEPYPFYSVSPSGSKTLWSKNIDGKNTFFVGDSNGENGQEIGRSEDYAVYGWFTDEYVLLTKKNSEMYIMPASGGDITKAYKITDYYKPNYYNRGFGYGYGG